MPAIPVRNTSSNPLPNRQTEGAAGFDLYAAPSAPLTLAPGERMAVPTGLYMAIPPGYEGQIRGRSGLALQYGISLANGVGTIDADYRGEVKVLLINLGSESYQITYGERIAQIVFQAVMAPELEAVEELPASGREAGGFGSTGG